jgi:hypothetical protein
MARKDAITVKTETTPRRAEESAPWRKNLTPTQERFADLAADLILNGGDDEDVYLFLRAAMRHERRRIFPETLTGKYRITSPDEFANQHIGREFKSLARNWPERPAKAEDPKPRTVKEMISVNVRRQLQDSFEEFMRDAEGLTDIYLLRDVFIDWISGHRELGEAFSRVLETDQTYIQVPWKLERQVRQFVELLQEKP